jgi:hypothetical protein
MDRLLEHIPLPQVMRVEQRFDRPIVTDVATELSALLRAQGALSSIRPGHQVAIGVGSRGITNLPLLVGRLVEEIKRAGGEPFIAPSMGSHGGATSEGQTKLLANLGITENTVGAPIRATMETIEVGRTANNLPVYLDACVRAADAVVIINVIKPHVAFRGKYESGLMKMITIGLGKQKGADICHDLGFGMMAENVPAMARVTLSKTNLLFAVGLVENAYRETCRIVVLDKHEIEAQEPALLEEARQLSAKLYFDKLDVLIIDEIGKDISGTGMNTNAVGRYHTPYASGGPSITRIAVLDITTKSGGNANGIGLADFTTQRAFSKISFEHTYPNSLTSTVPITSKIPMVLKNDRLAVQAAIKTCNILDKRKVRLVRIKSTKELDSVEVTPNLLEEVNEHPNMASNGNE